MSKQQSSSDTFGQVIVGLFLLFFLFSWVSIPKDTSEIGGFEVASLTFANGIFSGWADDIAIELLYDGSIFAKEAFRYAILLGEQQHSTATAVFNLLGAFLSIGGVIAVWVSRNASSAKQAFSLAFWAEIGEAVAFHVGYYKTVGAYVVTQTEVAITLAVAIIMGLIAIWARKKKL